MCILVYSRTPVRLAKHTIVLNNKFLPNFQCGNGTIVGYISYIRTRTAKKKIATILLLGNENVK